MEKEMKTCIQDIDQDIASKWFQCCEVRPVPCGRGTDVGEVYEFMRKANAWSLPESDSAGKRADSPLFRDFAIVIDREAKQRKPCGNLPSACARRLESMPRIGAALRDTIAKKCFRARSPGQRTIQIKNTHT